MIREQLGSARDRLLRGAHRGIELHDLRLECRRIGRVRLSIGRISLAQHIADHIRVGDGIGRIRPQVGIRLAPLLREGEVVDVLRLRQHGRADLDEFRAFLHVGLSQLHRRILELESVDEDDVSPAEQFCHRRLGLEGVTVRALGDDALDLHEITRNRGRDRGDRRDRGRHDESIPRCGFLRGAAAGGEECGESDTDGDVQGASAHGGVRFIPSWRVT